MQPTNRQRAEHYVWGQVCDGWHLVKDSKLSVIQERMPPGTSEVRHLHQKSQQFFFILSGEASIEMNGEIVTLRSGDGIYVPHETPHQLKNDSGRPVEFLVISQPPSHGDRVVS